MKLRRTSDLNSEFSRHKLRCQYAVMYRCRLCNSIACSDIYYCSKHKLSGNICKFAVKIKLVSRQLLTPKNKQKNGLVSTGIGTNQCANCQTGQFCILRDNL